MTIEIRELDIHPEATGAPAVYYRAEEITEASTRYQDYGALLVRLNVDGEPYDVVQADPGSTGDLEVLDRALAAITAARAELSRLYEARGRRRTGRCMASGDWGRCQGEGGHEGDHPFPTEEAWEADHAALKAVGA
jgi:hypothetical protein